MKDKFWYSLIFFLGFLSVATGAFAAHALEKSLTPQLFSVFETGNRYLFWHTLSLWGLVLTERSLSKSFKGPKLLMLFGLCLFSGNCFLYALTGMKTFALIVPIGGVALLCAWVWAMAQAFKSNQQY